MINTLYSRILLTKMWWIHRLIHVIAYLKLGQLLQEKLKIRVRMTRPRKLCVSGRRSLDSTGPQKDEITNLWLYGWFLQVQQRKVKGGHIQDIFGGLFQVWEWGDEEEMLTQVSEPILEPIRVSGL